MRLAAPAFSHYPALRPVMRPAHRFAGQMELPFPRFNEAEYQAMASQTQAERRGHSVSGRVFFSLTTPEALTYDDATRIQELKGYPVMGYDCMDFATLQTGPNTYRNTWCCATSCD